MRAMTHLQPRGTNETAVLFPVSGGLGSNLLRDLLFYEGALIKQKMLASCRSPPEVGQSLSFEKVNKSKLICVKCTPLKLRPSGF
jgi:hypothetical protein